mgnify:FL=1
MLGDLPVHLHNELPMCVLSREAQDNLIIKQATFLPHVEMAELVDHCRSSDLRSGQTVM